MRAGLVLAAACILAIPAMAYEPSPGSAQIQGAVEAGKKLAAPHEGYPSKDYLLYEAKDVLTLDPANGDVDAVVIATPLERTRHASFLHAYSGEAVGAATARREADLPDGWIEIIVFAHSQSRKDEDFLKHFTPPALVLLNRQIAPSSTDLSDADLDVYPRAVKDGMRYVAKATYKYDLTAIHDAAAMSMRLIFDDSSGKHFDLAVDLSRYD